MMKSTDNGSSVPPFLNKCYDMIDDEATDPIISWSQTNDSFIIWDMTQFSRELLPKYFKHSNFSSFMRQLNIYGFRKTDTDRWEFANDGFSKGQKHLLKNISRRKQSQRLVQQKLSQQKDKSIGAREEIENFGLWREVESLKTDKNALAQELVKLQQHQETSENKLLVLRERLQGMEKNQQQMLSFLVMAMQSPGILVQLVQPKENNWRMAEAGKNMLERVTEHGEPVTSDGMIVRYQPRMDDTPKPLLSPTSNSEKLPEYDLSSDGLKDLFMNIDFMTVPMDDKLLSSENHGPIFLPDLPDDGILEELLLASPFFENVVNAKLDSQEPDDSEMKMESTVCGTQVENQNFELLTERMEKFQHLEMESKFHETQLEKSRNLELITEELGFLASETSHKHAPP